MVIQVKNKNKQKTNKQKNEKKINSQRTTCFSRVGT